MQKEQIIYIKFDKSPDIRVRVIENKDTKELTNNKKKFPFKLFNTVEVCVRTTKRKFKFYIFKDYVWNGADIPRIFWRLIGSRTDNDYVIASMVHDYMLEFRKSIINDILNNTLKIKEYRRLTSLIFRFIIKQQGTNKIKANIMGWFIDIYQICQRRQWQCH